MRGKPCKLRFRETRAGITPADAGKTAQTLIEYMGSEDHPRGCGENPPAGHQKILLAGSPPRMRGKRICREMQRDFHGITPADAGKTRFRYSHAITIRDHPRGCGENIVHVAHVHAGGGSPPRMRGKLSV